MLDYYKFFKNTNMYQYWTFLEEKSIIDFGWFIKKIRQNFHINFYKVNMEKSRADPKVFTVSRTIVFVVTGVCIYH